MFSLIGKTALVTGASGGIGEEIARALAAQGARVAVSGTREEKLREVAAGIAGGAEILACDLSDPEAVERLFGRAEAALGQVDILVNNAGITRDGLILRMKDDDWSSVIDVNLTAAFRLCRAATKAMMKRRSGRIVNISSVVAVMGNPGQANYCASKAGMIGLTKSLAQEVASRGVTLNVLAPGFIETPMTHGLTDQQKERITGNIPAGRLGSPADIAAGVVYLASDEAAYVTGQTLHVNGGLLMV